MPPKKFEIPILRNILPTEVQYLKSIFGLYDIESKGTIPKHLMIKLLQSIGIDNYFGLPNNINFREALLYIDSKLPPQDQGLETSLYSFNRIVGELLPDNSRVIKPAKIVEFLISLERNVPTFEEVNLLLTSMLEYDDCSSDTAVSTGVLARELISHAKKNNSREFNT